MGGWIEKIFLSVSVHKVSCSAVTGIKHFLDLENLLKVTIDLSQRYLGNAMCNVRKKGSVRNCYTFLTVYGNVIRLGYMVLVLQGTKSHLV